jgi:hypothetical protein
LFLKVDLLDQVQAEQAVVKERNQDLNGHALPHFLVLVLVHLFEQADQVQVGTEFEEKGDWMVVKIDHEALSIVLRPHVPHELVAHLHEHKEDKDCPVNVEPDSLPLSVSLLVSLQSTVLQLIRLVRLLSIIEGWQGQRTFMFAFISLA